QFQHLSIEFVPFKVFVPNILPLTIKHTEGTFQIPQSKSPACFLPKREAILHPSQSHPMRRLVEYTPLADVNLDASINQWLIFLDVFLFESFLIPGPSAIVNERPRRRIESLKFIRWNPGCLIVADRLGQVPAGALNHAQLRDADYRCLPNVNAIDKDQTVRIHLADAGHQSCDDFYVALF